MFYDRAQKLPRAGATPLHIFFNVADYLGSSAFVIDKDLGEVVERSSHEAYGSTESDFRPDRWGAFREGYKFTGKEEDIEVGATYFGARYYNARLGRWMSPDPLTIHTFTGDLNPYAYVGGRVTTQVDPIGLDGSAAEADTVVVHGAAAPVDTVEVRGPPRGSPERKAELAAARAEALAAASQVPNAGNIARGTAHIPIPLTAKAYITPNGVRKSVLNSANAMLTGLIDPIGLRHIVKLAGFDLEGAFQIKVGQDDNDYSKPVGAGAFLAASIIVGKYGAPPPVAAESDLAVLAQRVSKEGGFWKQMFQTVSVLRTAEGEILVGGGRADLSPAQRAFAEGLQLDAGQAVRSSRGSDRPARRRGPRTHPGSWGHDEANLLGLRTADPQR